MEGEKKEEEKKEEEDGDLVKGTGWGVGDEKRSTPASLPNESPICQVLK